MAITDEKVLTGAGLAELWSLIKAENALLETAIAGTTKIATGSYVGTGTYDYNATDPTKHSTLTFPFKPQVVFIGIIAGSNSYEYSIMMRGCPVDIVTTSNHYHNYLTWGENTVSWYNKQNATYQLNVKNVQYNYIAIG